MSIENLKEQNILLPEDEWGDYSLKTTVAQGPVLILFLLSVGACGLTLWGNGNLWTWIGIITFFISFFGIVILSDRAIQKQRERTKKTKRESKEKKE